MTQLYFYLLSPITFGPTGGMYQNVVSLIEHRHGTFATGLDELRLVIWQDGCTPPIGGLSNLSDTSFQEEQLKIWDDGKAKLPTSRFERKRRILRVDVRGVAELDNILLPYLFGNYMTRAELMLSAKCVLAALVVAKLAARDADWVDLTGVEAAVANLAAEEWLDDQAMQSEIKAALQS